MFENTPRAFVGSATFHVTGMTCEHCRRAIHHEISQVPGVTAVEVDLAAGLVNVTAGQPVDRADITAAVDEAGYRVQP